jgi:hypothetical protein
VDVIESGPQRVWVRWTYFCVHMQDDSQPRLRGTEDYFAYPNGFVLRRMSYESLMPNDVVGYSTQPVELFGVAPVGLLIKDLFPRDAERGDYRTHAVLDLYSDRRYDIYWDRSGVAATMQRSRPFRGRLGARWFFRSGKKCSSRCSARPAVSRRRRAN